MLIFIKIKVLLVCNFLSIKSHISKDEETNFICSKFQALSALIQTFSHSGKIEYACDTCGSECHEFQNRFTNTWHLEPINDSKQHILGSTTNQTDWRQPFNVFRSQISFLFCSLKIHLFRSISPRNMCNKFAYHFDVSGKSTANQTLQLLDLLKWSSRSVKWSRNNEKTRTV